MESSNEHQLMDSRAELRFQFKEIQTAVTSKRPINGIGAVGDPWFLIEIAQITSIEQLVTTYRDKEQELSVPLFKSDPDDLIDTMRKGVPAYQKDGNNLIGYGVASSLLKRLVESVHSSRKG